MHKLQTRNLVASSLPFLPVATAMEFLPDAKRMAGSQKPYAQPVRLGIAPVVEIESQGATPLLLGTGGSGWSEWAVSNNQAGPTRLIRYSATGVDSHKDH
jgi:hypothetical protein